MQGARKPGRRPDVYTVERVFAPRRTTMRSGTTVLALFALTSVWAQTAQGTDRASITWQQFSERSTFVFAGVLTKAELLDGRVVRCTYRVSDTFKGEPAKAVTFDAPAREEVNTEVGTLAVVALRPEGE